MKLSITNQTEQTNAIIGIYGPPKSGKTFSLSTALPLGDVLHVSAPGEGNAGSSLRDYPIKQVTLECYADLMALESVLLNKAADWLGEPSDQPVARLKTALDPAVIERMQKFLGETVPATVALDGIKSFQADIFGGQSISHWGKDLGVGKYGDIADLTRLHLQRFAFIPSVKLVVFISQDQQISDKSMGGMESTYREMAFEGNASRGIIPPMCDMVLPIFSAAQLGEGFKPWKCAIDPPGSPDRDRYFALVPVMGYWAGARVGLTTQTSIKADLSHIWNKFYATKEAIK